ncbi:hypothetical protein B296_00004324 [Ensete ventricosum]|uniref:Uncharacterized protein n=1 Tax=Ensete ventricosum TaxID=4639 RepID=A0A426ZKA9_ENSVE|nr:hypothetical protein B296_00004324 [Ensete ventricosum]
MLILVPLLDWRKGLDELGVWFKSALALLRYGFGVFMPRCMAHKCMDSAKVSSLSTGSEPSEAPKVLRDLVHMKEAHNCSFLSQGLHSYYISPRVGFKISGAGPCSKGWRGRFFIVSGSQDWGFLVV